MNRAQGLTRHLSPMGAWAFAIGTSVGWGSLVVTANTYLAQAGPAGSVLGLALGALVMGVISLNYACLMLVAVVPTLILYVMVTLLSVTVYPPRYDSWLAYIRDLNNLTGLEALPAFYAADRYMGGAGVALLMLSLLALVITSLIGNTSALSRLMYAMAKDRLLPEALSGVNDRGLPARAVMAVAEMSCLVPLLGRTATGWIVDVTTIGATLVYGFVSGAAAHLARKMKDRREMWVGRAGLGLMVAFGAYLLVSNLVSRGTIARETYFLFAVWSVLGFWYFRRILHQDKEKRFGLSVVVWAATNSW